jgi:hypothetical protein
MQILVVVDSSAPAQQGFIGETFKNCKTSKSALFHAVVSRSCNQAASLR